MVPPWFGAGAARTTPSEPVNAGQAETTTCQCREPRNVYRVRHTPHSNPAARVSLPDVHRSARKGTSAGFSGGGSQPVTTALWALPPAYSLRHSRIKFGVPAMLAVWRAQSLQRISIRYHMGLRTNPQPQLADGSDCLSVPGKRAVWRDAVPPRNLYLLSSGGCA